MFVTFPEHSGSAVLPGWGSQRFSVPWDESLRHRPQTTSSIQADSSILTVHQNTFVRYMHYTDKHPTCVVYVLHNNNDRLWLVAVDFQEGPMIHSGAVVAAGISQGRSSTFHFLDFKACWLRLHHC